MHPRGIHAVNKYLAQLTEVGQRGKQNKQSAICSYNNTCFCAKSFKNKSRVGIIPYIY